MEVVRTRWTGGGSRRLTEIIVYSLLFVVVPPRLASTSCLPRYLDELPRALPRLPCVGRRGSVRVAKLMTLSCSGLPRRREEPQHDRRGAYFVHRTACCGFSWVAFGLNYLSELSQQALAQPSRSDTIDFGASAKAEQKLCVSIEGWSLCPCSRHGELQLAGNPS